MVRYDKDEINIVYFFEFIVFNLMIEFFCYLLVEILFI